MLLKTCRTVASLWIGWRIFNVCAFCCLADFTLLFALSSAVPLAFSLLISGAWRDVLIWHTDSRFPQLQEDAKGEKLSKQSAYLRFTQNHVKGTRLTTFREVWSPHRPYVPGLFSWRRHPLHLHNTLALLHLSCNETTWHLKLQCVFLCYSFCFIVTKSFCGYQTGQDTKHKHLKQFCLTIHIKHFSNSQTVFLYCFLKVHYHFHDNNACLLAAQYQKFIKDRNHLNLFYKLIMCNFWPVQTWLDLQKH